MSGAGNGPFFDARSGQYYYTDRNGNRRPFQPSASQPGIRPDNILGRTGTETVPRGLPNNAQPAASNIAASGITTVPGSWPAGPRPSPQRSQRTQATSPEPLRSPARSPQYTTSPQPARTAGKDKADLASLSNSLQRVTVGSGAESSQSNAGPQTPIAGVGGQLPQRTLDPQIKLRDKKFFTKGRVLLTLWTEPAGQPKKTKGLSSEVLSQNPDVYLVAFSQQAFCKVRRYIVIGEGQRSCTAIAISTHSGMGAANMRNEIAQHGVVYTGSTLPRTSNFEAGMQPIAIRVDPDDPSTALAPTSRINYGKIYTIEHNFKVKPYGMVNRESLGPLIEQLRDVHSATFGVPVQSFRNGSQQQFLPGPQGQPPPRPANNAEARAYVPADVSRAMARHSGYPSQAQRRTGQNPQGNAQRMPPGSQAPRNTAQVVSPTISPTARQLPSDAELIRQGFNGTQIRNMRGLVARGYTPQYAHAWARAMKDGYSTVQANQVGNRVQNGETYANVVSEFDDDDDEEEVPGDDDDDVEDDDEEEEEEEENEVGVDEEEDDEDDEG